MEPVRPRRIRLCQESAAGSLQPLLQDPHHPRSSLLRDGPLLSLGIRGGAKLATLPAAGEPLLSHITSCPSQYLGGRGQAPRVGGGSLAHGPATSVTASRGLLCWMGVLGREDGVYSPLLSSLAAEGKGSLKLLG